MDKYLVNGCYAAILFALDSEPVPARKFDPSYCDVFWVGVQINIYARVPTPQIEKSLDTLLSAMPHNVEVRMVDNKLTFFAESYDIFNTALTDLKVSFKKLQSLDTGRDSYSR